MVRRKQRSCHQCRSRHLRCDMQQPTCGHCRRGARNCSKESDHVILGGDANTGIVRRRTRYDLNFNQDQTWLGLPPITFTGDTDTSSSVSNITQSGSTSRSDYLDQASHQWTPYERPQGASGSSLVNTDSGTRPAAPDASHHQSLASQKRSDSAWPFKHHQEAMLMRYYVTELTPWFDHSDTIKHFGSVLPTLAATSPPLLNAILALASQHLHLLSRLDASTTLHYQDECFRTLLPDLQTKAFEPEMLAAVNLLRIATHMSKENRTNVDIHETVLHGFLGLDILVDAWRQNPDSTLHAALFLNALRLYIHVALVNKRPLPQAIPSCCLTSKMSSDPHDSRRINGQITVHVARVLDYCYDSEPKTTERWQHLHDDLEGWKANLPASFQPILDAGVEPDRPFGTVMFANDVHAASHQYHCLAQQLLINHAPSREAQTATTKNVQAETLHLLRRACAVAESHTDAMGIVLMSTLPILEFGHLLPDRPSQQRALEIMLKAQKNLAALTPPGTNDRLKKEWGWGETILT